jgi:hypothetical protein
MKTRIEVIGKERADYYLSVNINNRPVDKKKVDQFVSELINGNWKSNTGEAIKVSTKGFLLDGQHRMISVSLTGIPITMLVVYDLEESIFDVLDTGKPRGACDVFALNNVPNYKRTAAIIREYNSFKSGKYYSGSSKDVVKNTNASLLSEYKKNYIIYDKVSVESNKLYGSFNRVLSTTNIGSFYLLFSNRDIEKCESFFNQLCGSESLTNKSVLTLKNFLIRDKISLKKISPKIKYAFIIKTWNAFVLDRELKILKYDDNVEKFPVIL